MTRNGHPDQSIFDVAPPGHENQLKANRKVQIRRVIDILEARGLDPIETLCDVIPKLDYRTRAKTLLSLAEFVYPKLGRTELTGRDGGDLTQNIRITFG